VVALLLLSAPATLFPLFPLLSLNIHQKLYAPRHASPLGQKTQTKGCSLSLLPLSISTNMYTHIFTLILSLNCFLGLISCSF